MSNFKFTPDLFLEVAELNKLKAFLDQEGFRKALLQNTVKFGLIKTPKDAAFLNGKVERDLDTSTGEKTIKIRDVEAVNKRGLFLRSKQIGNITIPADGKWYWVKISHKYSNLEEGVVSLAINGDMVGSGTKFTETLRGMPNFPSRITFANSRYNTLEYDVLEVIDDEHAIVVHPAVNGTGIANFEVEDNLKYAVVGTFTPGVAIDNADKYPFEYDSLQYDLIAETAFNARPNYLIDEEFYIARVKVENGDVVVQDKRIEYWETKAGHQFTDIDVKENPLIGVESIKWQNLLSPANENSVHVAWGMRTQNWSIDVGKNIVTFFGSAQGGVYKDLSHFTDGDFDGWRLYNPKGTYSIVTSSIKQGQAINLTLDTLDVDSFSNDGGVSFNNSGVDAEWLIVVPNAEQIEIICVAQGVDNSNKSFTFPINTLVGKCSLEVFSTQSYYNFKYRLINNKTYTQSYTFPSDEIGYYVELSFDDQGYLKRENDRVRFPYTSSETEGYIKLSLSPNSYSSFINLVYKGDKIGVQTVTDFSTIQVYELKVGRDKKYQYISGDITLADDVYISLSEQGAVEGNEFQIHLDCNSLNLGGKRIYLIRDYSGGTPTVIKTIEEGDVYQMLNQEGGIVINCVFSDQRQWNVASQNYNLGTPGEIKILDGSLQALFNSNGLGKVKGLYGYAICDGNNNTPDLRDRFVIGQSSTKLPGSKGGSDKGQLTSVNQLPTHAHGVSGKKANRATGSGYEINQVHLGDYDSTAGGQSKTSYEGSENPEKFDILNPYYAVIYAKKLF